MADKKVSQLTAHTNLSGDDLLMVVNDPAGTPTSRKVSITNFFANVVPATVHKGVTTLRANTTISGTRLTISANSTMSGSLTLSGALKSSTSGTVLGTNGKLHANNTIKNGTITEPMMQTKPIANTVARNLILNRIQVANAVNRLSENSQIMSANLVVDAGLPVSTTGVHISNGHMEIFSATGSPSKIDMYCEVNNQHRVRIIAPTHANFGGNVLITLPNKSGNVATTNSEVFTGVTGFEDLEVAGGFRILNANTDPATSNALNEGYSAGSIFYSNTYLYVATDSITLKRIALQSF